MSRFDVAIIDYGMGNVRSVVNACESVGSSCMVATYPEDVKKADRIILPGVGAFGDAMRLLREGNWLSTLESEVQVRHKPILGICLGMQLLATRSYEHGLHQGLGWIKGDIVKIPHHSPQERTPHIGWNDAQIDNPTGIYSEFKTQATFYFVHSYVFQAADESVVTAWCEHGGHWAASVQEGTIFGVQFHPEKSQGDGLKLLRNFLEVPRAVYA